VALASREKNDGSFEKMEAVFEKKAAGFEQNSPPFFFKALSTAIFTLRVVSAVSCFHAMYCCQNL
jgi:hypothetical protein